LAANFAGRRGLAEFSATPQEASNRAANSLRTADFHVKWKAGEQEENSPQSDAASRDRGSSPLSNDFGTPLGLNVFRPEQF
jgi:hypothetical protein